MRPSKAALSRARRLRPLVLGEAFQVQGIGLAGNQNLAQLQRDRPSVVSFEFREISLVRRSDGVTLGADGAIVATALRRLAADFLATDFLAAAFIVAAFVAAASAAASRSLASLARRNARSRVDFSCSALRRSS